MRSATCTNSLPLDLPLASIVADPWAVAGVGMASIIYPMGRESKEMLSHTHHYYEINDRAAEIARALGSLVGVGGKARSCPRITWGWILSGDVAFRPV
jgi:hypothetical protein